MRTCVVVVVLALSGGCDSAEGSADAGADDLDPNDPCVRFADDFLDALVTCCRTDFPTLEMLETLAASARDRCIEERESPRVSIDDELDARCFDELGLLFDECREAGFDTRIGGGPQRQQEDHVCVERLTGLVADGDACDHPYECGRSSDCVDDLCTRLPGAGLPCAADWPLCAPDAFCSEAPESKGTCLARSAKGEPCETTDDFGRGHTTGDSCTQGLFCDNALCVPVLADDEPAIGPSYVCASGAVRIAGGMKEWECGLPHMCSGFWDY